MPKQDWRPDLQSFCSTLLPYNPQPMSEDLRVNHEPLGVRVRPDRVRGYICIWETQTRCWNTWPLMIGGLVHYPLWGSEFLVESRNNGKKKSIRKWRYGM